MITKKFSPWIVPLLSSLLLGCGKSPFLDEKPEAAMERFSQNLETHVEFPQSKIRITGLWRNGPHLGDESKLLIILTDQHGHPTPLKHTLKILLWMPTMGHGSFPVTVTNLAPGVYEATEVFFTMSGYWDVHFQLYEDSYLREETKWGFEL